jgi:hypothetical protein
MSGAQLFVLLDPDDVFGVGKPALHLIGGEANYNVYSLDADFAARLQHVRQHGPAADFMQHLRELRVHPCAAACRQDYRYRLSHLEFTIYY